VNLGWLRPHPLLEQTQQCAIELMIVPLSHFRSRTLGVGPRKDRASSTRDNLPTIGTHTATSPESTIFPKTFSFTTDMTGTRTYCWGPSGGAAVFCSFLNSSISRSASADFPCLR
jgi:hypothetical protein